jgi:hypothetical protein
MNWIELLVGWDWVSWCCGHYWPIVPAPDDRWWWLWRNWWNEDWQGKPKYSEKTWPSATLSTINPTCLDPGSNPGRRGGKSATNRLSYFAALNCTYVDYRSFQAFLLFVICIALLLYYASSLQKYFASTWEINQVLIIS